MLPAERITAYFAACSEESPAGIARHFTDDAVVYDTNVRPMIGSEAIGAAWVKVRERWQGAVWTFDPGTLDTGLIGFDYGSSGA
jgi:ketosteroid isomerase-like protein